MSSVARTWGSTPAERAMALPCDHHLDGPDRIYHRAVGVEAPAGVVFRWLCQLRVAPYSYDLIDNAGRRSPRTLTPGLEELEIGQPVMRIFELAEFERDRHITLALRRPGWLFGDVAVTYAVIPDGAARCRLVVRLVVRHPQGSPGAALLRSLMPWLDLLMMRRQLLNLKELSEGGAAAATTRRGRAGSAGAVGVEVQR